MAKRKAMSKQTLTINPVTRIEGHGKITIHLDEQGKVAGCALPCDPVSGIRKALRGPPFLRNAFAHGAICGICPVSHLLASAKACDAILATRIPPTAVKLRRS